MPPRLMNERSVRSDGERLINLRRLFVHAWLCNVQEDNLTDGHDAPLYNSPVFKHAYCFRFGILRTVTALYPNSTQSSRRK